MRIGDIVNQDKGCDPIKKYYNSIGYYLISNFGEKPYKNIGLIKILFLRLR